ncbi:ABC transporter ATP-binding protein [Pseudoalteromonas sp. 68 DY56-GL68]|uniref:ABC transporter ATP-binding protein n=1 Tax=Pseudoalteromonas sp. 68 DY56-GL68 TaxID=2974919 RepID=UPI00352A46C9
MINLRLDNLKKSFHSQEVLSGIDLKMESSDGRIIGVIGKNGAGKSTLFKILSNIDKDYTGSFICEMNTAIKLGFLPEERSLPKFGSISDILLLWARIQGVEKADLNNKMEYWFKRVQLWELRGEKITSLSKGNQQKLQLACALIHEPNLIIFDEPFSGLDPNNQELVIDILNQFKNQGALILLSAHQLELVERISDICYLLTNGILDTIEPIRHNKNKNLLVECYDPTSLDGTSATLVKEHTYLIELENLGSNEKLILFELISKDTISIIKNNNLRNVFLEKLQQGESNE